MIKLQLRCASVFKSRAPGSVKLLLWMALALLALPSCNSGHEKNRLGLVDSRLTPCPSSPNCVSSDANNAERQVAPFVLIMPPEQAWALLIEQVSGLSKTNIVRQESRYLHVECRSRIFSFVDDVEFHLRPEQKIVAVRSASRTGYYDFGVNRSRIEKLRQTLQQKGVVQ